MSDAPALKMLVEPPIGWLIVDRPAARGAMTRAMWLEMPRLLSALATDASVRVVVIRGTNGHFIAGADIGEFRELRSDPTLAREYDRGADDTLETLAELAVPSIAMIEGACMGGGCLVAFGCDLRIAADDAKLGIPAGRLGLAYPYKGVERLVALLGESRALDLLLTARVVAGSDAERSGLVQRAVPPASLEAATRRLAADIAENAPLALRFSRMAVRRSLPSRIPAERIQELAAACFESADYAEGVAAFLEKRRPKFSGR
jgi:enoyl-CoA hydratase/carnithine racemase